MCSRRLRCLVDVALVALLPLLTLPARAQAPEPDPEQAAPVQAAGPPLGVRFALPNGIVVLVAERPALPIVSVRAAIGGGAVLDPREKAGLAHLTALLLSRGTSTRTGPEIDRAIEFVGGRLETDGGRDQSAAAVSVIRRDLALGLDLLADVLLRPTFPVEEFERIRDEVRAAVRRSDGDPPSVAGRVFRGLIFPGHPYAMPVSGTEESLGRITRDDVAAFYAATYRPDRTTVAVVGDITVAEARGALTARFGAWAPAGEPVGGPGMAPLGTPAQTETIQRDLTQATVLLGKAVITRPHADHYPLLVAGHILAGGSSSRLYVRVREERGLAHRVYGHYAPARHGGMMLVGFQSQNARLREALALVRAELIRLRRQRVSDAELRRAQAYLVGSFPLRMDTNAEVASLLLDIERFSLGLDYPMRYRRAVEAVTAEEILRAARTHLDPELMSLVIVGNLRAAGLSTPSPEPPSGRWFP